MKWLYQNKMYYEVMMDDRPSPYEWDEPAKYFELAVLEWKRKIARLVVMNAKKQCWICGCGPCACDEMVPF